MQNNIITKLLNIQDVKVKDVKNIENSTYIYVETKKKLHACPSCKTNTNKVHDYRSQKIQHLSIEKESTYIVLKKRRYVCFHCGKRFYENYSFIQKNFRKSNNVVFKVISDAKQQKSLKTIAIDNNISIPTVNKYISFGIFLENKKSITTYPKHIGIDEFKGNAGKDKYQVQIIDLDTGKVVDIIETRKYDDLERCFSKITNRNEVEIVAMDLYMPFKRIIQDKFPRANIVADCFHFTRKVIEVLDKLRISVEKNMGKDYRNYFKGIKKLLAMRYEEIKYDGKDRLLTAFELSPKLNTFHSIKEEFLKINDTTDATEKEKLFRKWLFDVENYNFEEFESCIKTLRNWHKYISNYFKYKFSNGITEGTNNKIKVLKRVSYGFRNFNNFRNRILIACS